MRYQPVTVAHITSVPGLASMKRADWLALADDKEKMKTFPNYWAATSKLLGECGHKHKTEASAQPCAEKMRKAWRKECNKRRAAARLIKKKRDLRAACDAMAATMPVTTTLLRMANGF